MSPFGVDETENKYRYLNGQILTQDQFAAFTTKVKSWQATRANLFTTETNWQAEKTNSKLGQCGKFVVDDTAGTIRLPCVINAQGLIDLAQIGVIKNESLPNITGSISNDIWPSPMEASGAFYRTSATKTGRSSSTSSGTYNFIQNFDASLSSSTYQDNAPVQQEAIQYPYAIVVNTGVEEAERPINNYQVNNVYSYGMSQYYKGTMNNNSWLKSAGQWNDGTVYTGMYNWLLEQVNAGVSGFKLSTSIYSNNDFVINTANQTFRLPLKNGLEGAFAGHGVKGNNVTLGLIDGTNGGFGGLWCTNGGGLYVSKTSYATTVGTAASSNPLTTTSKNLGLTTDYTVSGMIVDNTVPDGWNLYYYVGDTLQNASLVNIARIEEKLTDMNATSRGYLVESYRNGTEWYRVYSDGWIEQGGNELDGTTTYPLSHSVTFLKPFNTLLSLSISMENTANASAYNAGLAAPATTTGFKVTGCYNGTSIQNAVSWYACGY